VLPKFLSDVFDNATVSQILLALGSMLYPVKASATSLRIRRYWIQFKFQS